MTIKELRIVADSLVTELKKVGEENHLKPSSKEVRLILGKIKNATPQLRRDLLELDK